MTGITLEKNTGEIRTSLEISTENYFPNDDERHARPRPFS